MPDEPISEAEYERLFQHLLQDETGAQFRESIDQLSPDGQVIFRRTLMHMITILHTGDRSTPLGIAVMRAYIDHYFPDRNIPSKEALFDLMRSEAKKIQAIAETSFIQACQAGIIQGPPQRHAPPKSRQGCLVMIFIMTLLGATLLGMVSVT